MFFFASAYAVSSSFWGTSSFRRRRLGGQDLLKDQVVEETQFPGRRLFLRQRLQTVAHAPVGLVDGVPRESPCRRRTAHVSAETVGG